MTFRMSTVVLSVLVTAVLTSSAHAQLPNRYLCPKEIAESDVAWTTRCEEIERRESAQRAREAADYAKKLMAMRATLLKQPALPANRNWLIGRWREAPRPQPTTGALGELVDLMRSNCALTFGDGIDFTADRWVVTDAAGTDDLGPVAYREGEQNTVYVIPQAGLPMMAFQRTAPDRFNALGTALPCTMVKATAANAPATGRAAAPNPAGPSVPPPSGRAAAPPPGRAAGAPAASPASRPAVPPAAAPAAATGPLLTFADNGMGYQCPNGQKPIVVSCDPASATIPSLCKVLYAEKPLSRSGFQMTDIEPRSALVTRVNGCKAQKVIFDSAGNFVFAP